MKWKSFVLVGLSLSLSACVVTREEIRGGNSSSGTASQKQQVSMQQEQAEQSLVLQEYDNQFKDLRNRLDLLENQLNQMSMNSSSPEEQKQQLNQQLDQRFKVYEEALKNLEIQILGLVKDIQDLKKKALTESKAPKKGAFEQAEALFDQKKWQEAILSYQNYRDQNPNGKNYAEATYKIGVCFQELNMKSEAKAFYSEVLAKFPKSKESKKADYRLKNLK